MAAGEFLARSDAVIARFDRFAEFVLRFGLGLTILLAGVHKLFAPSVWHDYLAPPFVAVWPTGVVGLDVGFVLFGVSEVVFGLLLLANWHTPTVALLTAISLLGVVVNLVIGLVFGMPVWDILIRDLGLTAFATGVALEVAGANAPRMTGIDEQVSE